MFDPSQGTPDLSEAEEYVCARCGYPFFSTIVMVKKLSGLVSPTGQDMFIPQAIFKCEECSYINRSQFGLPEDDEE